MNIYLLVIIISLIGSYLISLITGMLNLAHLKPSPPREFKDVIDSDEYRKSQLYTWANSRLDLVNATLGLVVLLPFILFGGFNVLDQLLREYLSSDLIRGLAFMIILSTAGEILSLPFEIYRTFVLEERFGFNKTTPTLFVMDKVKSYLLAMAIGIPLLTAVLLLFQEGGALAWVWCWGVITLFMIGLQYLAPRFILPLFNTFTPLDEGELKKAMENMATKVGFNLEKIYVMDGSKRSLKSNAFFMGFGRNKRVALYDTLIDTHTDDELLAVMAHELGHYKMGHIRKNLVLAMIKSGLILFLISLFISYGPLFDAFGMEHISVYAGLVFFFLLYTPISLITGVLFNLLSRRFEYQADRFARKAGPGARPMISALKKLAVKNLSNLTPHPLYVFFHYSHPPILERIRTLKQES